MIIYKDILGKLKEAGYNTNRLRKEKLITESTLTRIRNGGVLNTETIDKICTLTGLPIEALFEHVPDKRVKE